ncbi:MAG TPA: DUF4349 domain-containing protein [Planctomycetota bacterium]|nr:DUF4349 domain-containing protein [Planctomycetota bacterium]
MKPGGGSPPSTYLASFSQDDAATADADEAPERLVVYNAALEILVAQIDAARAAFVARVEAQGGYLQKRERETVTCRVPARRFSEVIEELRGMGRVLDEMIEALDVTKEHRDLEIRLGNARRARDRLLALLERAESVDDIIAIEKELSRLTELIERLEAELDSLRDRIAYSTIRVTFRSNAPEPTSGPARQPSRFGWIRQVGLERAIDEL